MNGIKKIGLYILILMASICIIFTYITIHELIHVSQHDYPIAMCYNFADNKFGSTYYGSSVEINEKIIRTNPELLPWTSQIIFMILLNLLISMGFVYIINKKQ